MGEEGGVLTDDSGIILKHVNVRIKSTVVSRPLNSYWRLRNYPSSFMPFYLYGNNSRPPATQHLVCFTNQGPENDANIDHVITRAPNTQLSASGCKLDVDAEIPWDKPLILLAEDVFEAAMQPFPPNRDISGKNGAVRGDSTYRSHHRQQQQQQRDEGSSGIPLRHIHTSLGPGAALHRAGFFFRPGATLHVGVYLDGGRQRESAEFATSRLGEKLGEGTLRIGDTVFVDSEAMNHDPFKKVESINEWRREFDRIGRDFD